jgi:molybdopterin-containing oxidoreductase family iron-sulfur binding subunit
MPEQQQHYWKDWRERRRGALPLVENSHDGPRPGPDVCGPSRRDFLTVAGFALAGAGLAGCRRAPVQHAVPYLVQPENIVAGVSYQYASVCGGCPAGCGLLVNNRDCRPIKLEGNPDHPLSRGGLCAVGQASLLGLYDSQRLKQPNRVGRELTWSEVDQAIRGVLQEVGAQGMAVRFLTGSIISPTTRGLIHSFLTAFPGARHVVYDPRPASAILEAHAHTHGARLLPHYQLDKADVLVGFDVDFLGTWISPVEFTAAYQKARQPDGNSPRMSYHVQFESHLSLTGSKADQRQCVLPGEMGPIMSYLLARLAERAGVTLPGGAEPLEKPAVPALFLDHLADTLWQNRQRSLMLCGSQDVNLQILCNALNHLLGNYGATLDVAQPSQQAQGNDDAVADLLQELHDGQVGALFVYQCNPVHDLPGGTRLADELRRVPLLVCCSERQDETTRLARYVCPVSHYLEAWSDAEPVKGLVSVVQPAITPLGNTRPLMESLAAWMGRPQSARDLVRAHWETEVFPSSGTAMAAATASTAGLAGVPGSGALLAAGALANPKADRGAFEAFWDRALQDGFARITQRPVRIANVNLAAVRLVPRAVRPVEGSYCLVLYSKVAMPDASHAYNPWLQELPDPISKVCWDNYACVSPATATRLGIRDGDVVRLEGLGESGAAGTSLELPVFVQPGLHGQAVAVALGYGSQLSARFADIGPRWLEGGPTVGPNGLVGQNAALWLTWVGGSLRFSRDGARITKAGRQHPLASTQGYDRITVPAHLAQAGQERRSIVQETTLAALHQHHPAGQEEAAGEDLWPDDHAVAGPHWGMVIDLNACTGCSACVIACQVENNVPVVGKDEVRRHREMHWLRLDRYYSDRDKGIDVVQQPMLCQHCENAPCEAVCPVLATVHSSEGLNQQVYNRCVGTRYCANNCPYKVRRFNWFDYAHDDVLQNLALNPDVTVRTRGVMEKCTFCVQRILEARRDAASRGIPLRDGELQTACQQSCPAHAITFGNRSDRESQVARQARSRRGFWVLEELNVRPSVSYLAVVRNRPVNTEGNVNG